MKKISVNASKSYDILFDQGLLPQAGSLIAKAISKGPKKLCIVTDDLVEELYSRTLVNTLELAGYQVCKFVFPHGESSKTLATLSDLLEFLAENQLTRSDALVALGGGVVGDLTGFAAASYLRGIEFIQIPTTLLAAVDSSVGGKTGVNLAVGKNLAGAFWQPTLVLFDTDVIKTLSDVLRSDGIAEAIKAAAIADAALFKFIMQMENVDDPETLTHLVMHSVAIKKAVVEADERDIGSRQLLNFGHTVGHAIETCSNFSISHGHAVAIGMAIAAKAAVSSGWCESDCADLIIECLRKFKFPLDCPYSASELTAAALKDKKRTGNDITLVIPIKLGVCQLKKIPISQLKDFIKKGLV